MGDINTCHVKIAMKGFGLNTGKFGNENDQLDILSGLSFSE